MQNLLAWTLGGPEMIVICVVILLLFGAKKIPELARGIGKAKGEFDKARDEFDNEIKRGVADAQFGEDKKSEEPVKKAPVADAEAKS